MDNSDPNEKQLISQKKKLSVWGQWVAFHYSELLKVAGTSDTPRQTKE